MCFTSPNCDAECKRTDGKKRTATSYTKIPNDGPWIGFIDNGHIGDVAQQVAFVFFKRLVIFVSSHDLKGPRNQ